MRSLLVDDIRTFNTTRIARNFDQAIDAITNDGPWDIIYLDHDLGENEKTGYDVISWIEQFHTPPGAIVCVSMNPPGRDRINQVIKKIYGGLFHNMYWAHPTAIVDPGAIVGSGTKIWHYSHISSGANIGEFANIGQNVFIAPGVQIGVGCKIQNNVSVYAGVTLGNYVFCGPSCVFSNDPYPRADVVLSTNEYSTIIVHDGASIGANATIVVRPNKNITIGKRAMIGAGSVVIDNVPDYGVVVGNPARIIRLDSSVYDEKDKTN